MICGALARHLNIIRAHYKPTNDVEVKAVVFDYVTQFNREADLLAEPYAGVVKITPTEQYELCEALLRSVR